MPRGSRHSRSSNRSSSSSSRPPTQRTAEERAAGGLDSGLMTSEIAAAAIPAPPTIGEGDRVELLDHGFVRLDASMADDLSVANAARVSFARRKEELDDSDRGLIRFLMRDRHGTPFEHNSFRFHIRCPIFVAREWMRHRVGSFNEFSLRYAKATDDFYVPERDDVRTQVGKPGAYTFEPVDDELAERTLEELRKVYDLAYDTYNS